MNLIPSEISEAVLQMSRLPGIGEKTALKLVLNLSKWNVLQLQHLANSIENLSKLNHCSACGLFTDANESLCDICKNSERVKTNVICVIENYNDYLAIEKSNTFKGLYHLLGGVLNPLIGIGPSELKIDLLVERIKKNNISELILAINPSVEGDATCSYLKNQIDNKINTMRIGFGIPIGGSLEYLDSMTISKAFENRRNF